MQYFEEIWNLIKSSVPLFTSLAKLFGKILLIALDFITKLIREGMSRI